MAAVLKEELPMPPLPEAREPESGSTAALSYQRDLWERSVLFLDILRERADRMLEHEAEGLPPVLAFAHQVVLDARGFERPAGYALVRITGEDHCLDEAKPPVIVVDPRAGHGPGDGRGASPLWQAGLEATGAAGRAAGEGRFCGRRSVGRSA